MIEKVYRALGGRKFIGLVLLGGGAIAVDLTTTRGLSDALATFLGAVYTIYAGTNILSKKMPPKPETKHETAPQLDPNITLKLDNIENVLAQIAEGTVNTQQILIQAMNAPIKQPRGK